jgi:hypothetical protein
MAQAGDLHWERKTAGVYETAFYANGYRYRIVKKDSLYDTTPRWYVFYRWHNWLRPDDKPLEWKPARMTYSNTLKDAKENCLKHNIKPRTKYKFVGRVTPADVQKRVYPASQIGNLVFAPVDNNGIPMPYRLKYVSEKQYMPWKYPKLDEKEVS